MTRETLEALKREHMGDAAMPDKLSMLISDIERRIPNPDGTFAEVLEFLRELQRLRAALPKTADGVTVVPGMTLYDHFGDDHLIDEVYHNRTLPDRYSTREAALKSK